MAGVISTLLSRAKPGRGDDPHAERLWMLGELAASIAHDLGQPLNVIRLNAEAGLDALDRDGTAPARVRRALEAAVSQTTRLRETVDALVAATRRPDQPPRPIAPAEIVQAALAEARPGMDAHIIQTAADCDPATPAVSGHSHRLKTALAHLLANAVDAVMASALDRPPGWQGTIAVSCKPQGDGAAITIADNGPGLPAPVRAALESRAPVVAARGKGCGLGLTIVLGIVAEMNGTLQFEDTSPGTRVVVRLPALAVRP